MSSERGELRSAAANVVNRKNFLRLGAVGLAGIAMVGVGSSVAKADTQMVSAKSLGISPDNDGITNRENLVKALSYSRRRITFPDGDYLIDNSANAPNRGLNPDGVINIDFFEGELVMESNARLVFTHDKRRGFAFYGGTGMSLRGFKTTFRDMPGVRVIPQECIYIQRTTDTLIEGADIHGSASAGFVLWECIDTIIRDTVVRDTMADGIHFVNCKNPRVENIRTRNTGDDGLAFNNYIDYKPYTGGYANNVQIEDSKARGIIVGGQSDVTIENFTINGTNASGLLIGHDAYWKTRSPQNVTVRDGEIRNAGKVQDPAGKTGNKYGIEIDAVGRTNLSNIQVISPANRGVSGVISRNVQGKKTVGPVKLTDISVSDAPGDGYSLYGVSESAPLSTIPGSGSYNLQGLSVTNCGGPGMVFMRIDKLNYTNLKAEGTSRNHSLRRAFWFTDNRTIDGTGLRVVDSKSSPTGYKVSTYRDKGLRLGKIYDQVSSGKVVLENKSRLACQMA